jgi:biopolymer transport protein ExbD
MMAITASGQFLFDNQIVDESALKTALQQKVLASPKKSKELTLVLIPDKSVSYEVLTKVRSMAKDAGVSEVLEAVRPSGYSGKAK